jgi:hypothetical protein
MQKSPIMPKERIPPMQRFKTVLLQNSALYRPALGIQLLSEVPEPFWYREDGYDFGSFRNEWTGRHVYQITQKGDRYDYRRNHSRGSRSGSPL